MTDEHETNNDTQHDQQRELPSYLGDIHFLTLNEKKKLYLAGPEGWMAQDKAYYQFLKQEQVRRAKCAYCFKKEAQDEGCSKKKLSRCSKCEITAYCSKDCQKKHWKKHKKVCKEPDNTRFKINFQMSE